MFGPLKPTLEKQALAKGVQDVQDQDMFGPRAEVGDVAVVKLLAAPSARAAEIQPPKRALRCGS
jgi:hypothetical protein